MKPKVCNRATFRDFDEGLYDLGNEARTLVREAVERRRLDVPADADQQTVQFWACTLGPLMFDIAGSLLLLLSHGQRRAPAILNRCLFEYQIRLRYYSKEPEAARTALLQ
jgi:hypothetical protein